MNWRADHAQHVPFTYDEWMLRSITTRLSPEPLDLRAMKASTVGSVLLSTSLFATAAHADVVTDWNSAALAAVRAARTSPPHASRALAMLHVAIYDAVNGITRTHETYRVQSAVPRSASEEAAATAAARTILVALFPGHADAFEALNSAHLAIVPDGPHETAGVSWGERVAAEILQWRSNDNADAAVAAPPSDGSAGTWQPTEQSYAPYLLPQWAFVDSFAIPAGSDFRPDGPPALDSSEYARDYNEVKLLGARVGSSRTPEQDLVALFWADGAGTATPPGHWNAIAQDVAWRQGNTLEQNARLFALLNVAMADAAISAWDAKYTFNTWRPVTAIRSGDDDGNAATAGDPTWSSLIVNPPFPEYVSGHSTFSGAAARVLALFYGSDDVMFATSSDSLPGVTRQFQSFSGAALEAAMSRLYGGIHFRSAIEDGLAAGVAVGEWTVLQTMTAKGSRSRR